ncbi:MAG: fumarylacetoacetate hydrolase family protein [Hyphomicrobiales bacterium]|nr:fumarylacetoacetate hydrolase family protein [Hyphomicrobiales bacterium]
MELVTFEAQGRRRVGALLGGSGWVVDMAAAARRLARVSRRASPLARISDMVALLDLGAPGMAAAQEVVKAVAGGLERDGRAALRGIAFTRERVVLRAPVPRPTKFVFCGLNYPNHAEEGGRALPTYPSLFTRFASTVIGPDDDIVKPVEVTELDYEGELAFVIGRRGRHVSVREAMDYVAGYTVINDITAREFARDPGLRLLGKNFDTFGVMGPALVTADAVPRPDRLTLRTHVNGALRQDTNTSNMIFGIPDLIAYLSRHWTIEPGDVVSTGTPAGVGAFMQPPRFLQPGDRVRVEIEGVGSLENRIVAEPERR